MALISVVIPTITGREYWVDRCASAYRQTTPKLDLIVVPNDGRVVGEGWQAGSEQARGDYLHLTNDDCEPLPGWWREAVKVADRGDTPAGPVLNEDGTLNSTGEWADDETRPDGTPTSMTRIPFCTVAQWQRIGPMLPVHYYSDNWFSWRAREAGIQPVVVNSYRFVHYFAPEGRRGGEAEDHAVYRAAGGR